MTEQRTEREIDFFELEVAPEEKVDDKPGWDSKAVYMIGIGDVMEMATAATLDSAHRELQHRISDGYVKMEEYIADHDLEGDYRPVVHQMIGMGDIHFQIGIERIPDTERVESFRAIVEQVFGSDPKLVRHIMAMCTPGRDPLTGHGVE